MVNTSKTIDRCQISGIKDLKTILSLGYLPPVNKLKKINSTLSEDSFYPAELMFSPSSKLVQMSTIDNKKILFLLSVLGPKKILLILQKKMLLEKHGIDQICLKHS